MNGDLDTPCRDIIHDGEKGELGDHLVLGFPRQRHDLAHPGKQGSFGERQPQQLAGAIRFSAIEAHRDTGIDSRASLVDHSHAEHPSSGAVDQIGAEVSRHEIRRVEDPLSLNVLAEIVQSFGHVVRLFVRRHGAIHIHV